MPDVELRARVNLSFAAAAEDPLLAYRVARDGLELARRLGMRGSGYYLIGNAADLAMRIGDWDWARPELEEAVAASEDDLVADPVGRSPGLRGDDVEAELEGLAAAVADLTELQARSGVAEVRAEVALAHGRVPRALEQAQFSYRLAIAPGWGCSSDGRSRRRLAR